MVIEMNKEINKIIDSSLVNIRSNQRRHYLGASRLGVSCSRQLQYEYQDIQKDKGREFTPSTLRVFTAGHLFEDLTIKWLKEAGFELLTANDENQQYGFKALSGKLAGHVDGIITKAPAALDLATPCIWETKSLNTASWRDTARKGLILSKPIYAAQIALYQAYMEPAFDGVSTNPALFTAINKDTAELYHELIPFDGELAQRMSDKAVNIIRASEADELLPRIASSRDFYECKLCPYQDSCWGKEDSP